MTPQCPTSRPDLFLEEVEGELLVFDPASKTVHVLNSTAAATLLLCDGSHQAEQIAEQLLSMSPHAIDVDAVSSIIEDFSTRGLLTAERRD